jgi:hypothetical protein
MRKLVQIGVAAGTVEHHRLRRPVTARCGVVNGAVLRAAVPEKGKNMRTNFMGIDRNNRAPLNLGGQTGKRPCHAVYERLGPGVRHAKLNDAGPGNMGSRHYGAEVKITGKDRKAVGRCVSHNFGVRGMGRADRSPITRLNSPAPKHIRPPGGKVYINKKFHQALNPGQGKFMAPGKPGGVLQGLQNILPLKIGVIGQQRVNAFSRAYLGKYSADGNTHSPDAWFAAHNSGILRDAVKWFNGHDATIPRNDAARNDGACGSWN